MYAPHCTDGQGTLHRDHEAEGWLKSPEGSPITAMCHRHALKVIAEYRDKLDESWTFREDQTMFARPRANLNVDGWSNDWHKEYGQ